MKKSFKWLLCLLLAVFAILLNPSKTYAEEIKNNSEQLNRVFADIQYIDEDQDEKSNNLLGNEQLIEANELYIDGELIGVYPDENTIRGTLEKISELYKEKKNQGVKILNKIEIKNVRTVQSFIYETDEIYNRLLKNKLMDLNIRVEKGTSLDSIIDKYGLNYENLEKLNPEIKESLKEIKDEKDQVKDIVFKDDSDLTVIVRETYLDIEVFQFEKQEEEIDYQVIEEYSDEIYEGERIVSQEGIKGILEKKIKKANINFKDMKESLVSQKVTREPVNEVILIGTKPRGTATGTFMMPTTGNLTSGYGYRWGGFHAGIDLANPLGTPIYSSDGGVVTEAGWYGSYGNKITIDHGNGFKTVYAHLSEINVGVGENLVKGQYIGAMGSTGFSTGSHLHFEIRLYDQHVNPYNYL